MYFCQRVWSSKLSNFTFLLRDVKDRSGVCFHAGNTTAATEGCILLGFKVTTEKGDAFLLESKRAYAKFLEKMKPDTECTLLIR